MENKKLKTFEDYGTHKPGKNAGFNRSMSGKITHLGGDIPKVSDEENVINNRIKEVIDNILKVKTYFMLLQDTTEQVYEMIEEQIPGNKQAFVDTLFGKNQLLGDLLEDIIDLVENSTVLEDIMMMTDNLENLEKYTEDNMDNLLNGKKSLVGYSEEEDYEEEDEDEDEDDEYNSNYLGSMSDEEIKIDNEDQLKRKTKPLTEQIKRDLHKDTSDFIKKHSKIVSTDKFKKGDIVYLNGITTAVGKIFNGKKCEIVKKSDEKEDCYDLYDPSIKGKDGDSNVKGMPTKYIFRKKPSVVTQPEEKPKTKPRATKKAPRK